MPALFKPKVQDRRYLRPTEAPRLIEPRANAADIHSAIR